VAKQTTEADWQSAAKGAAKGGAAISIKVATQGCQTKLTVERCLLGMLAGWQHFANRGFNKHSAARCAACDSYSQRATGQ
jgi:hypothetical protein